MNRELTFLLGTFTGGLFLAGLGAFLWYVPMASLAAIVATLVGMVLMFLLGIQTGARENQPAKSLPELSTSPEPQP
jgi:hypothetical protein